MTNPQEIRVGLESLCIPSTWFQASDRKANPKPQWEEINEDLMRVIWFANAMYTRYPVSMELGSQTREDPRAAE